MKKLLGILCILLLFLGGITVIISRSANTPDMTVVTQSPQKPQLYLIGTTENNTPVNVTASTLPQFAVKLAEEKFKNMWTAHADTRKELVDSEVTNAKGDTELPVEKTFNDKNQQVILTPVIENNFKPGLYKLKVKVNTYTGETITVTQDFTWGVLAINTNKGFYMKGDTVNIGMAVIDDYGYTKCIMKEGKIVFGTARLNLTVTSPSGKVEQFSTDDNTIEGSKTCADRSFTNIPDFLASTKALEPGKYIMHVEAETIRGKRGMDSFFMVRDTAPYDIERVQYPMRIYPRYDYPVKIKVTANRDFHGVVYDTVPSSFTISSISDNGDESNTSPYKTISWHVEWMKGETHELTYIIHFPPISPEFYLVGPLKIGQFSEGHEWQIASDSLFSLVQEAHATATTGTSVSAILSGGASAGNLLVLICLRDQATTINTPSGWTRRYRYTGTNPPRLSHFDRLATAGFTTGTCSFTSNGSIASVILEFSGTSTSGYFDKAGTPTRNTTCNTGSHQTSTPNLTPTNPDELLVSGFVSSAGNLTASAHNSITGVGSSGFSDTETISGQGFSDANASYDVGWGEAVNNPATAQHDTITYSGAATACVQGIAAYNAQITISQGSYRFFENTNNANPTTIFGGTAAVNTPITLNQPNYPFRLRMLLDVDSTTGSLGIDAGDFILQYAVLPTSNDCADGTYTQVLDPPSGTAIAFNPNAGPASGDAISAAAGALDPADTPTYTTVLENYFEDTNIGVLAYDDISNDQNAIANNQAGLFDFSLIDNSDDSSSHTYCLKITDASGNDLAAYRNYPKVTTIDLDVNIRGGTTIHGGTTIR